jgi:hypothetical protein
MHDDVLPPHPSQDFAARAGDYSNSYNGYYNYPNDSEMSTSPPMMVENGLTRDVNRPAPPHLENPYDGIDDEDAYNDGSADRYNLPPHHGVTYGAGASSQY